MAGFLKFSERVSLAFHALSYMAEQGEGQISVRDIAEHFSKSTTHMAQVARRLVKAKIMLASRGAGGGCRLARPASAIALIEVYEAIEGPLAANNCLFETPRCEGFCIFGSLNTVVNNLVVDFLKRNVVSDMAAFVQGKKAPSDAVSVVLLKTLLGEIEGSCAHAKAGETKKTCAHAKL